jgi:2-dehydro-3-deoxygalactonokinase
VAAAGDGGALTARLFGLRGLTLRGGLPAASASAWLSGLLIGAEIAALWPMLHEPDDGRVVLIGEGALVGLYARALVARGAACEIATGEAPALAGLRAIWSAL